MSKGPSYIERVHSYLIREGEHTRAEIREALNLTPKTADTTLARLVAAGAVAYNGVPPHRMYYAKSQTSVQDMRGRKSTATQFGRSVRFYADSSDRPLHPPVTLKECLASPTLHPLEQAWVTLLFTRMLAKMAE